jgi:hypothetical protein
MRARSVPFEEPIDLVAVQADDELINALAAGMAVSTPGVGGYDADDHVAAILAAWRREVDSTPIPELVDIDAAVAAVESGRPRSRARHLAPVAAAAAFVVLAVGGVSVGSYGSHPGDALWGVSKVLYSERAKSVEAAARVETNIDSAKRALMAGQPIVAEQELQKASAELGQVRPEEGKAQLAEVQDFLIAKADETDPGTPTDPGKPLKRDHNRHVPAGAAITVKPSTPDPGTDPTTLPETSATLDPTSPKTVDPRAQPEPTSTGRPSGSASATPTATATGTAAPAASGSASPTATSEGGPATTTTTTATPQGLGTPSGDPTVAGPPS